MDSSAARRKRLSSPSATAARRQRTSRCPERRSGAAFASEFRPRRSSPVVDIVPLDEMPPMGLVGGLPFCPTKPAFAEASVVCPCRGETLSRICHTGVGAEHGGQDLQQFLRGAVLDAIGVKLFFLPCARASRRGSTRARSRCSAAATRSPELPESLLLPMNWTMPFIGPSFSEPKTERMSSASDWRRKSSPARARRTCRASCRRRTKLWRRGARDFLRRSGQREGVARVVGADNAAFGGDRIQHAFHLGGRNIAQMQTSNRRPAPSPDEPCRVAAAMSPPEVAAASAGTILYTRRNEQRRRRKPAGPTGTGRALRVWKPDGGMRGHFAVELGIDDIIAPSMSPRTILAASEIGRLTRLRVTPSSPAGWLWRSCVRARADEAAGAFGQNGRAAVGSGKGDAVARLWRCGVGMARGRFLRRLDAPFSDKVFFRRLAGADAQSRDERDHFEKLGTHIVPACHLMPTIPISAM